MKHLKLPLALAAVTVLVAAGCGRSDDDDAAAATNPVPAAVTTLAPTTSVAPTTTAAPAAAPTLTAVSAKVGESELGEIMTNTAGMTLYGFLNDVDAISTCYSTCADAWPPVIVDEEWTVGPGLDTGVFSTTERDDGTLQLVAGKFPLYTFGGDANPGDLAGQGSGDVWFAVALDGTLIEDATTKASEPPAPASTEAPAPAVVATAGTDLGDVLVDQSGLTLYGFTKDADGAPTCAAACADAWPPLIVDGPELPAGLDPAVFSVVERPDGALQLKAGKWPLYRFAGDGGPGDVNGQASGGVWFVVNPLGGLIKDAG